MKWKRLLAGVLSAAMMATGAQLPVGVFAAPISGSEADTQLSLSFEGNLTDASQNNISVTSNKSVTYVEGIQGGQALDLDGSTYLDLGTSGALQPENLTVSCWIKPDAAMSGENILAWFKDDGNWASEGWYISLNTDGYVSVRVSTGTGVQESTAAGTAAEFFPVGEWTHLVVTFDGATNTCSVYRNGVAQTVTTNGASSGINETTAHKYIGFNGPVYGAGYANFALDEFNVLSKCATSQEVVAMYAQQGGSVDYETLAQADLDAISFANTSGITNNLNLPTQGSNGSTITWESSAPDVISTTGVVTRPAVGSPDATVTLTATAVNGTASLSKEFTFTVAAQTDFSQLTGFAVSDVQLTDEWLLEDLDLEIDYLLSLDADKMLVDYYNLAGVTTTSNGTAVFSIVPYEAGTHSGAVNWEDTNFRGNAAGHMLSGLAYAWANTVNDPDRQDVHQQIEEKLSYMIENMKLCQDAYGNGYLGAFEEANFTRLANGLTTGVDGQSILVPWWTMDAILSGLITTYEQLSTVDAGNETAATAREMAQWLGEWCYETMDGFTQAQRDRTLTIEYGGMNNALYNLYHISEGYENWDHFIAGAHYFDEKSLFDQLYQGIDCLSGRHANTTIPKIIGAMNRYMTLNGNTAYTDDFADNAAAGDMSYYLTVAENFWDIVVNHHTYITGGNSWQEHFHDADVLDSYRDGYTNETCNVYNMLKLTRMLFEITGNQKYADFYDNTYTNSILSAQNHETGMSTYWQAMGTGYFKVYCEPTEDFWCCTCTSMESFTKLNDSIYYHNDNSLYAVLLYGSDVTWTDKNLVLSQTDSASVDPEEIYTATFTVNKLDDAQAFGDFDLRIRVPDWSAGDPVVKVNGEETSDYGTSGGFIILNRDWADGDTITVEYPMTLVGYDLPDASDTMGLKYGPWVLSADLGEVGVDTYSLPFWGYAVHYATSTGTERQIISMTTDGQTPEEFIADVANHYTVTMDEDGMVHVTLTETDAATLDFTPHYAKDDSLRYGIYFTIGEMDSPAMQQTIRENKEANAASTHLVDSIVANDDQRETNHNMQTNGSSVGSYSGTGYRQADGEGGYFSYDLAVNSEAANRLMVQFHSQDAGNTFAIYIDDTLLETVTLDAEASGFFTKYFDIPLELTQGKEQVTLKFACVDGSTAGPIYGTCGIVEEYDSDASFDSITAGDTDILALMDENNIASLTLPEAAETLGVKFTPSNVNAVVTVNDIVIDDTQVRNLELTEGTNLYEVTLTSEDGNNTVAYTLVIYNGTASGEVDTALLDQTIETAQNTSTVGADSSALEAFQTALENALAVQENPADQAAVNAAAAALRDAMLNLEVTASGVVGSYSFEGNLTDEVTGETGTTTGSLAGTTGGSESYVDGVVGQAVELSGAGGYKLPTIMDSDTYTVSFWMKADKTTNYTPAVFLSQNADNWVSITPKGWLTYDGPMVWSCTNSNTYADLVPSDGASHLTVGEWTHVALVAENGVGTIYVNGQAIANGPVQQVLSEGAEVYLGVNFWDAAFDGAIDELYISQQVEDYSTIAAQYWTGMLQMTADEAAAYDESLYTEASYQTLTEALDTVNGLLTAQDVTVSQYRSAWTALEEAISGLVYENVPGDLNDDNVVDVLDVMTLAQIVTGKIDPPEGITIDFNTDEQVNVLDVMILAQVANGSLTL